MIKPIIRQTSERLKEKGRFEQVLILISFGITFVLARIFAYLSSFGIVPPLYDNPHIHHLVPGIILLIISGYLGISFYRTHILNRLAAVLFGIGAALTIDEFALWVYLRDVYWSHEGRLSLDAIILVTVTLVLIFIISEAHDHRWIKRS